MEKPVFKYSNWWFGSSAVLSIPLLIDICTACHLFPLWMAWFLFILIGVISIVRLWYAFSQHLYKFAWGLIGQLLLGAAVLVFFQLSYNRVIETPVSNPVTPAVVNIEDPLVKQDSSKFVTISLPDSISRQDTIDVRKDNNEKKEAIRNSKSIKEKQKLKKTKEH